MAASISTHRGNSAASLAWCSTLASLTAGGFRTAARIERTSLVCSADSSSAVSNDAGNHSSLYEEEFIPDYSPKKRPQGELRGAPSIHWPPKGQFDFEVVGESFYQDAIQRQFVVQNELVKGGGTLVAELIPEDDNPYDGNAIAVFINDDLVGYMSRNDAKSFRIRLSKHGISKKISTCNAVIQEHERSSINNGGCMYSVWLDLQLFRR